MSLISSIINNGNHAGLNHNEVNRLKIFNSATTIILLISIFYTLLSIIFQFYMALFLTSFSVVCCFTSLYLASKRIYNLAYHFVMNYGFVFLIGFCFLFGDFQKTYLYFMFMIVAANIMFDCKKTVLIYFFVATICIAFFVNIYNVYFEPKYKMESSVLVSIFGFTNTIFTCLLVFLGIKQFKNESLIYQHEIENKKTELEEKQQEILASIRYAKKIQQALLPNNKALSKILNKTKPK